MTDPSGRVVAELGRPETLQETAERKARDRSLRRSRQNWRNLVASLAACLGIVVLIIALVPRGSAPKQADLDVRAVSRQFADTAGQPLLAPSLPSTWKANAAELRGSGDQASWYVGYIIGGSRYVGLTEGLPGTPDLITTTLDQARSTGTTTIGGLPWRVYDQRSTTGDIGNVAYGLATRIGKIDVMVYGTAPAAEVRSLAAAVATDAASRGIDGTGSLP